MRLSDWLICKRGESKNRQDCSAVLLGPRRVRRSGDGRSITELKYHFINLHLLDSILLSTKMKGLAHLQISKRLKEIDFKKINEDKYRSRDRDEKNAKRRKKQD